MMLIIDFSKLNSERLNTTLAEMGVVDFNSLPLPAILERMGLWSNRKTEENFPLQQCSEKIDLSADIQELGEDKKIVDVIGPTMVFKSSPVCFSTLLGTRPKVYLKQYIEVARILCKPSNGLKFIIWLEDTLTVLKNGWDVSATKNAVQKYKLFFAQEFPNCQIMLSSEIAPVGVPQDFVEKLSTITTNEFLSALPFHLRNPIFVKTLDIVHFVWNCYVLHKMPGVYLAGINNKRHFQLFRKIVGSQITAVLLPLGSENFI
jgi:hypothetical protein